jgi:hypothetical protein
MQREVDSSERAAAGDPGFSFDNYRYSPISPLFPNFPIIHEPSNE